MPRATQRCSEIPDEWPPRYLISEASRSRCVVEDGPPPVGWVSRSARRLCCGERRFGLPISIPRMGASTPIRFRPRARCSATVAVGVAMIQNQISKTVDTNQPIADMQHVCRARQDHPIQQITRRAAELRAGGKPGASAHRWTDGKFIRDLWAEVVRCGPPTPSRCRRRVVRASSCSASGCR